MFSSRTSVDIHNLLNASESQLAKVLGRVVSKEHTRSKLFLSYKKNGYLFTIRILNGKAVSFTIENPYKINSYESLAKEFGFTLQHSKTLTANFAYSEFVVRNPKAKLCFIRWSNDNQINCLQFYSVNYKVE